MITDVNPFVYSRPISPEEIVDRDEETQHLLKNAVGGHYVRLYAPRKYGKTSLLRRALADGEKQEGLVPVLVDLYGVVSLADVAVRFERAYAKELRGAIRGRVEEFTTTEVPAEERPPLIGAYLQQFGTLPTVASTFRALPDPADHPTFRITCADQGNEGPTK